MPYHKQCELQKGAVHTVSWIPESRAKIGKILSLKGDNGWKVLSVGTRMDSKLVLENSQDHKSQRDGSDISSDYITERISDKLKRR